MRSKIVTIKTLIASVLISSTIIAQDTSNIVQKWDFNNKSPGNWEVHPEKNENVKIEIITENEKESRLLVHVPAGWTPCLIAKNIFLEGAKTLSLEINPGTDFEWIKIQPVLQSSATEWDPLGEKDLQIDNKWQSFSFNIDMSKHANNTWNQIVFVINCDKTGKVLIDNITITK